MVLFDYSYESSHPATSGGSPAGRVTRSEAAKILGVSIASVRRLEQAGRLHPEIGDVAVRHFDIGELERLRRERQRGDVELPSSTAKGKIAQRVFRLLQEAERSRGYVDVREIVIECGVDPTEARRLIRELVAQITGGP